MSPSSAKRSWDREEALRSERTPPLEWPMPIPAAARRGRAHPFAQLRIELDLRHERLEEPGIPLLRQFESLLHARSVVEPSDLLRLSANALHAFSARGFSRVDHWEVEPGGWLPLPEPTHASLAEPVGHLVRALHSPAWERLAAAHRFSVRLSGPPRMRADLVVRRVHRERGHSISIELRGSIPPAEVERLVRGLGERLPILRATIVGYDYRSDGGPTHSPTRRR